VLAEIFRRKIGKLYVSAKELPARLVIGAVDGGLGGKMVAEALGDPAMRGIIFDDRSGKTLEMRHKRLTIHGCWSV
jgi:hypothetical protein